jgi:hypothetical protein
MLPSYKIDLEDQDQFVIAGDISISDDELEMLNEYDTHSLHLDFDDSKLEPLYKLLKRRTSPGSNKHKVKLPTRDESYGKDDLRITKKTQGAYLNGDDNALNYIIQDRNADELSQKGNNQEGTEDYDEGSLEIILKSSTTVQPAEYDYESLRSDYYHEVQEALHSNKSFNYDTRNNSEETTAETIEESLHFQKPEDKGKEEGSNFVTKAIEWMFGSEKWSMKMDKIGIINVLVIIASLGLLIILSCWCRLGILCCCFRCSFCLPGMLINRAKRYTAVYPPGVCVVDGVKYKYEATEHEKKAYSDLRKVLWNM